MTLIQTVREELMEKMTFELMVEGSEDMCPAVSESHRNARALRGVCA